VVRTPPLGSPGVRADQQHPIGRSPPPDQSSGASQSPPERVSPPSTTSVCPVIHDASADSRRRRRRDVVRLSKALQRVLGRDLGFPAGVEGCRETSADDGRRHRVDPHRRRQLDRERLGQRDDRRLRDAVPGDAGRGSQARDRCER
jgi:hypothetical protein